MCGEVAFSNVSAHRVRSEVLVSAGLPVQQETVAPWNLCEVIPERFRNVSRASVREGICRVMLHREGSPLISGRCPLHSAPPIRRAGRISRPQRHRRRKVAQLSLAVVKLDSLCVETHGLPACRKRCVAPCPAVHEIRRVAHHRKPEMPQMHADLIGAPGTWNHFKQ